MNAGIAASSRSWAAWVLAAKGATLVATGLYMAWPPLCFLLVGGLMIRAAYVLSPGATK